MTKHILVIGGGHNGLIAANLLAKRGLRVTLLEASARLGGAAQTHEFAPGFKVSSVAHLLYQWDPTLTRELNLHRYGFAYTDAQGLPNVSLSDMGQALTWNHHQVLRGAIDATSANEFSHTLARWLRLAAWLDRQHKRPPARLGWTRWKDAIPALKLMLSMRLLGRDTMQELLRLGTMAVQDVLDESISDPRLQAGLALDAVLGTHLGPRSGNSFFSLLHRLSGLYRQGHYQAVQGGMGSLTHALEQALLSHNGEVIKNARVARIETQGQRVSGVRLSDGTFMAADGVLAALAVKPALLELLGAQYLSIEQVHRLKHLRQRGCAAKVHLGLNALPRFTGVAPADHSARLLVAASAAAVDAAFNPVKYAQCSQKPVMECHIPTIQDKTLAPANQHVLSAIVQYVPYHSSVSASELRAQVLTRVLGELERYAPGISASVIHQECLLPVDIEAQFNLPEGHWHHGEITLDQALMLRPVPTLAQYRTPVHGLWLCGAGTHPGGGVMGLSARLSVAALLSDLKQGRLGE
jgi:phytoene dehydrogenase-like protein